jgi:hypothetical protein
MEAAWWAAAGSSASADVIHGGPSHRQDASDAASRCGVWAAAASAGEWSYLSVAGGIRPYARQLMKKLRIVTLGISGGRRSRGRFATPTDFPLQDCRPYSHVHERRERLGVVHRSRNIFCRPVPNPHVTIRNFSIAVASQPPREGVGCSLCAPSAAKLVVQPPLPARVLVRTQLS